MESHDKTKIIFVATIRKTEKGHWYLTIPPSAKSLINLRDKIMQVTLERVIK